VKNFAISFIKGQANHTTLQLFRFTLVGGLASLVDFATLYVLTDFAGLHYLGSVAIAFIVGVAVNYSLSINWVFNRRTMRNPLWEFLAFSLLGIMGLGLNELIVYLLTGLLGVYYLTSKIAATGLTYFWSFFSRKYLLFSRPADSSMEASLTLAATIGSAE
jgi:putative flippase GtrA